MSLAQQEFNQLLSEKPEHRRHPEDQQDSDHDHSEPPNNNQVYEDGNDTYGDQDDDDDYDDEAYNTMIAKSTYHVPSTVFAANTGPKGVIADAQSYERAKKKSFRRTLMSAAGFDRSSPPSSEKVPALTQTPPDETEDERFMRQWREVRMRELAEQQNQVALRRASPGGRKKYGSVEIVSANAYLDAVEDAAPGAVVVVCIYDPEVNTSFFRLWNGLGEFADRQSYSLQRAQLWKTRSSPLLANTPRSASSSCTMTSPIWSTSTRRPCWPTGTAMSLPRWLISSNNYPMEGIAVQPV
jgi:hypothetical protein